MTNALQVKEMCPYIYPMRSLEKSSSEIAQVFTRKQFWKEGILSEEVGKGDLPVFKLFPISVLLARIISAHALKILPIELGMSS